MTRLSIARLIVVPMFLTSSACSHSHAADPLIARASALAAPVSLPGEASRAYARPPAADLRSRLTPLQFQVTQTAATEPPFQNAYWNNHADGIYVDVVSGEPLFTSQDKFESGTGWPSFTQPIEDGHIVAQADTSLGMVREEVISKGARSHLGHVFDDGPAPTGKRYCINSASLRFVPLDRLAAEGYAEFAPRFEGAAPPSSVASANAWTRPAVGRVRSGRRPAQTAARKGLHVAEAVPFRRQ